MKDGAVTQVSWEVMGRVYVTSCLQWGTRSTNPSRYSS